MMRLNMGKKIFGIAFIVLLAMIVGAGISTYLTAKISEELETIADKIIPLAESVTQAHVLILEQGIMLQRLIVLIEVSSTSAQAENEYEKKIRLLEIDIKKEFSQARRLLAASGNHAIKSSSSLVQDLDDIEKAYAEFEQYTKGIINVHLHQNAVAFHTLIPDLNKHQDARNDKIAAFYQTTERLTNRSVHIANQHEHHLLLSNVVLTILATLFGLTFAGMCTSRIVSSVKALVYGTECIEDGKLDTNIPITTKDEIGDLTGSFNHMVAELRLKERIKETFGKYMDPRIVHNLVHDKALTKPGGEMREMTVMFVDLAGFTAISEKLTPQDLVKFINFFFSMAADAIAANKGVVDKFMGDAVMAYWGPPFTSSEEQAQLACKAALAILHRLDEFRQCVTTKFGSECEGLQIDLRIGISTGVMVVGTIGSDVSRNFTVMGDPVNLGSRLEGANKVYGTHILVSERTQQLLADSVHHREIDVIVVKGKTEPIRVYEVIADASWNAELAASFQQGLTAYRAKSWDAAEKFFLNCQGFGDDDPASSCYLARVAHFRAVPPVSDWNGVWEFRTK